MDLSKSQRLIIKVGSSITTDEASGTVREQWLASIVDDIAALRQAGKEVIVVSSGAVALGRKALGIVEKQLKLEEKQAAAACGQILLMKAWRESLAKHHISAAQMLLTIDESENRRRYLNARNTLETLLSHGVVPVINENDTVATAELRFGDNDRLAARVAQMASADTLVLFSDIDGLYTADPNTNPDAQFIAEVKQITPEIEAMGGKPQSLVGSGGMITKIAAAKIALAAGCHMVITAGKHEHPLKRLQEGGKATWFIAQGNPMSARKHWIAGSVHSVGSVTIDAGAEHALREGKSLLPAGVKAVEGAFERGDAVSILSPSGKVLGKGLTAYSAEDTRKIMGHKSQEIEQILGFAGRAALIHRDDMVMEGM